MAACRDQTHRASWRVVHRRCNYSAFNGYRWTPSAYSLIRCLACGHFWRTKAAYVSRLPDATREEATSALTEVEQQMVIPPRERAGGDDRSGQR